MPTFLPGVKPSSDSVADAWAKSAANVTGITNGNLDREINIYKTRAALEQQEIENKRAQAVADMAKEKYDAEKATLAANKDFADRLQGVLSGEYAYDGELTKSMSDAYTSTLAKTGSENEAMAAVSRVEAEGKRAILNDPVRLKNIASYVGYSEGDNIDIKDQIMLKHTLFAPLDKKEEQNIAERDRKDKLDLDIKKMNIQERQFNQTLAASKQKSSGGGEDKSTDTEKKINRLLPGAISDSFNKLSTDEKAAFAVTKKDKTGKVVIDQKATEANYYAQNYSKIYRSIYQDINPIAKAATPSTGKTTISLADYSDQTKYENAPNIMKWINDKNRAILPGNLTRGYVPLYTYKDIMDALARAASERNFRLFRDNNLELDLDSAEQNLKDIAEAKLKLHRDSLK